MKGLILAGGLATRLRPLTHTGAKQLIPIANKPVIHYVVEDLANAGVKEIGIIVGYDKDRINSIMNSVGDGSKWGVKVTYIEQDAPRGLAHAIGISESFMNGENFVVYLGDNMIKSGIKSFVESFDNEKTHISLLLARHDQPHKFGVAVFDEEGNVIDVEEKPENPKSNYVITGIYIFTPDIFNYIKNVKPGKGGELQITDAIKLCVEDKDKVVKCHKVQGWWDDAGTAEAILNVNHMVLLDIIPEVKGKVSPNSKIFGKVGIGENTIIHENSLINGPVIIGNNCEIGPNTYIGPYTSIGDDCKIKGGEIESSILVGNTTIDFENGEKITHSLIGKHSKVISRKNSVPRGNVFVLGENSELKL